MKNLVVILSFLIPLNAQCQTDFFKNRTFSEADSLRGALRPERTCFDVTFYDLHITVDTLTKAINGYNDIYFTTVTDFTRLQIDLFVNMAIDSVLFKGSVLKYERIFNAVFIQFPEKIKAGDKEHFKVYYHGKPPEALNPPWEGGFTWRKDDRQNWWIAVTCEGLGASVWWPNKDYLGDEPDSMAINFTIPNGYDCVSNGRLRSKERQNDGNTAFHWFVSYPINNYDVTLSIGVYAHFSDVYTSRDGDALSLDYFVLPENLVKAKEHFKQVKTMLACYEKYLGKYPFWRDGYKLIETPHLGMEHQSAIAYGNKYMRGYLGGRIPNDMNWDFIIIHESGHEYFGNAVSCRDHADMWLHEGFTTYLESLFVEYTMSYVDAQRYLVYQKRFFSYNEPIVGPRDVNYDPTSDIYFKGSWILHTLRSAINDDAVWFDLLKSFYQKYKYKNIDTVDFIDFVNAFTHKDYAAFFKEYLYYVKIPTLLYRSHSQGSDLIVEYQWDAEVKAFNMPVKAGKKEDYHVLKPVVGEWKQEVFKNMSAAQFNVATELFLVEVTKTE